MKKKLAKLLICISMIGLIFSLSACGNDDEEASTESTSSSESEYMYSSIKEYVESDEVQNALAEELADYEDMGMSMELGAEDNKLIYIYQYTDTPLISESYTLEDAQEYFDSASEGMESTFSSLCTSLTTIIDVEDPAVVIRYYDVDGTLIWEKEYTAED